MKVGKLLKQSAKDEKDHLNQVKGFHDISAARYRAERYHVDTCEGLAYVTRKALILNMLNGASGKALDIGCGPGILTKDLVERGLWLLSADLSLEMIKHARSEVSPDVVRSRADFAVTDASKICLAPRKIDVVLCIGLMCYVTDHGTVLSEIGRVLVPGGLTIIQINNIRWPSIYRLFVPLYHYMKSKLTSKSYEALNFAFNFSSRKQFLCDLEKNGFRLDTMEFYDFRVPFIDILFPKISVKLGKAMFRKRRSRFLRGFAHGILIKAAKNEKHDDR